MTTPSKDTKTSVTSGKTPDKAPDSKAAGIREGEPTGGAAPSGVSHYQRAGQARQIVNELTNMTAHGAGDSERAVKLRRTLEDLEVDLAAVKGVGEAPEGRGARSEKMIRTDSPGPSTGRGMPPGVSVPPGGSAPVTTTTDVKTSDKPSSENDG